MECEIDKTMNKTKQKYHKNGGQTESQKKKKYSYIWTKGQAQISNLILLKAKK